MCSATTYLRVVHRGEDGAMTYSGLYRCSGCDLTFSDPADWRIASEHGDRAHAPVTDGPWPRLHDLRKRRPPEAEGEPALPPI